MASSKLQQPMFCAAIDFGKMFTLLAFAEDGKSTTAVYISEDCLYNFKKVPTTVLFDPGRNFLAFGLDAEKKYNRMNYMQKHDCYYFERFIMELQHEEVS